MDGDWILPIKCIDVKMCNRMNAYITDLSIDDYFDLWLHQCDMSALKSVCAFLIALLMILE